MKAYFYILLALVFATVIGWFLRPVLAPINIAMIYLLVVVLSATSWGFGPALLTALLGVLTLDALFVPPYGLISISEPQDGVTYAVFIMVGIVTSELGARLRTQVKLAQLREHHASALYALSQEIAFRNDRTLILDAALAQIHSLLQAPAEIFLCATGTDLVPYRTTGTNSAGQNLARRGLETGAILYEAGMTVLPLQTAKERFGVLLVHRDLRSGVFHTDEIRVLEALAAQLGLALEHLQLAAQAEQARVLQANDRFHQALLSSVSHDLRTPMTAILGATFNLLDEHSELSDTERREFLQDISEQTQRLNRRIGNLLEMTRLESGIRPQFALHSVSEVIDAALGQVDLQGHTVDLHLDSTLPLVSFDFGLIEQVVSNLVENAIKFSPTGTRIEISAARADRHVELAVQDLGIGIPPPEREQIFERFYRGSNSAKTSGSGLGLMICKGIVEAHGGRIFAEPRDGGGTAMRFTLPLADPGDVP